LLRFLAVYLGLAVAGIVGFSLAGVKPVSGLNVAILIGAVYWACLAFGKKNARYFTPVEKKRVVWGMVAIDVALQMAVMLSVLGSGMAEGGAVIVPMLAALAFVSLLHAALIYFFVGNAGKLFAKEQARALAKIGG
jgi:hypothetical protein